MCYLFHNKYFFIPDKKYKLKVNSTNIKYYISLNVNVFPSSVIKVKRLLSNLIFFEFCKIFKYWLSIRMIRLRLQTSRWNHQWRKKSNDSRLTVIF